MGGGWCMPIMLPVLDTVGITPNDWGGGGGKEWWCGPACAPDAAPCEGPAWEGCEGTTPYSGCCVGFIDGCDGG